uniref:Uncharacterized protein n=1 Tax=Arundo donax TaxID=35708 RepID=A0A0A8Y0N8_ARUDO
MVAMCATRCNYNLVGTVCILVDRLTFVP